MGTTVKMNADFVERRTWLDLVTWLSTFFFSSLDFLKEFNSSWAPPIPPSFRPTLFCLREHMRGRLKESNDNHFFLI